MLPKITITYGSGALGLTQSSADGLLLLAVCGATSASAFELAKHYSIRKLADLEALGVGAVIDPENPDVINNPLLHATVKDFYNEAPNGTQLYVVGYPGTLTMSAALDKDNPYIKNIIEQLRGELRGVVITKVPTDEPTIANGMDNDMELAKQKAQALGDWAETSRYAPMFSIIDGLDWNGSTEDINDMKKAFQYNRVGVVLGSTTEGGRNQAVGVIAGRIAAASVDTNIGAVANGAVTPINIWAKDTLMELADMETIYSKAYISFQTFTGRAGYFISDDQLATFETDDYRTLTARRTIDKAYRLAYNTLLEQLKAKLEVNTDGTLQLITAKAWEQMVINGVSANMVGELSTTDADNGVQCSIDPTQNVISTSEVNVELRVRPFGYARWINVLLGFTIMTTN